MHCVTLNLHTALPARLDGRNLQPDRLADMTADAIAQLPLSLGRRRTTVGEWFSVHLAAADTPLAQLCLVGDCRRIDYLGHSLQGGELVVQGDAGDAVGYAMRAGTIHVRGNVGARAGMSMRGGLRSGGRLWIDGNAGDYVGGPAPGERSGMSGGQVIIGGSTGDFLGQRMRRGTIMVGESAGDFAAAEMVAGTIAIGANVGASPALGMRRGTLLVGRPPRLAHVGFTSPRAETPSVWPLLRASLSRQLTRPCSLQHRLADQAGTMMRSLGDLAAGGMGEVLWFDDASEQAS